VGRIGRSKKKGKLTGHKVARLAFGKELDQKWSNRKWVKGLEGTTANPKAKVRRSKEEGFWKGEETWGQTKEVRHSEKAVHLVGKEGTLNVLTHNLPYGVRPQESRETIFT